MRKPPGWNRLWTRLQQAALQETDAVWRRLPRPLKAQARLVALTFEPVPSQTLVDDGLDADTLGLYVGEPYAEQLQGIENVPAQIVLFLENLWEYAGHDTAVYREEVRVTYLHELGHFLGLDEDDLVIRSLD